MKEKKSIHQKLFTIQTLIENPKKTTDGYNYKFSPLDEVLALVKPHLLREKLLLVQRPLRREARLGIHTELINIDCPSEIIVSELTLDLSKKDAQAAGSALSYARRYSILALFGLSPVGDDEDGNKTLDEPKKVEKRKW